MTEERLHEDVSRLEIEQAFAEGLRQRENATRLMREKASALLGRAVHVAETHTPRTRLHRLGSLAASTASNSAPDALGHVEAALEAGATRAEVQVAIGIAHTVRRKAQGFSDAELSETPAGDPGCGCG